MYSCLLPSGKIAVHRLLRLLNWHVVIEFTSVKKRVKLVPLLLHLCVPINISCIETTDQFEADVVVWSLKHCVLT